MGCSDSWREECVPSGEKFLFSGAGIPMMRTTGPSGRALHEGQVHRMRSRRCGMRVEGPGPRRLPSVAGGVGDVLVALGEDLGGEPDDAVGDALGRVRSGLLPQAQSVREDASECLQGEGIRSRLVLVGAVQLGDGSPPLHRDIHEPRGCPRFGGGEPGGCFGVGGPGPRRGS